MLNPIEVTLRAEQREKFIFPRASIEAAELFDGFDVGVFGEDDLDGEGVVSIDEECHLLLFAPSVELRLAHD